MYDIFLSQFLSDFFSKMLPQLVLFRAKLRKSQRQTSAGAYRWVTLISLHQISLGSWPRTADVCPQHPGHFSQLNHGPINKLKWRKTQYVCSNMKTIRTWAFYFIMWKILTKKVIFMVFNIILFSTIIPKWYDIKIRNLNGITNFSLKQDMTTISKFLEYIQDHFIKITHQG